MNKSLRLLIVCIILGHGQLFGQPLYPVSLDRKIGQSTMIAEGTVLDSRSFWNPSRTMIYTSHTVKLHKLMKGLAAGSTMEVLTIGGQVGDQVITASELLQLAAGESGLFFCRPADPALRSPVTGNPLLEVFSSSQGFLKYDIYSGRASAPFDRYPDIESDLYPALRSRTGKNPVILDPGFKTRMPPADRSAKAQAPLIASFTPAVLVAGKYSTPSENNLTINGSGFGTPTGSARIGFDNANDGSGGAEFFVTATSDLIVSWTDMQIVVRVPGQAGTGSFTVYDNAGLAVSSPAPLEVSYAILTAFTTDVLPNNFMYNLTSENGSGGYTYFYSISTDNGGANFAIAASEPAFDRAISTWRDMVGVNFVFGGNSTLQTINLFDGINLVMLDNNANGPGAVLPEGVLAVCYAAGYLCSGNRNLRRTGFEIIIRNPGISAGSVTFNNGPCATTGSAYDMETTLLHELGHALNLGHIIDSYQGSFLPYLNPAKVMNFTIVNGSDRRSPDWSALAGARYNVNPRALPQCGAAEMLPLTVLPMEAKDECPLSFPATATPVNTTVFFDLNRTSSNKFVDPQFTAVTGTGNGTSITNNAWYAIRTGSNAGSLNLSVSGYNTVPANQAACSGSGVELSLYQVSSCPPGQAFPAPLAYRTFNDNGTITAIGSLAANTNYLLMADGLANTKAAFNLTMIGSALPVRFLDFSAEEFGQLVQLNWVTSAELSTDHFVVERSANGLDFEQAGNVPALVFAGVDQYYSFIDPNPFAGLNYYRIRQIDHDGRFVVSRTIQLERNRQNAIRVYPNPAANELQLILSSSVSRLTVSIYTVQGVLIRREQASGLNRNYQMDISQLSAGLYLIDINADGRKQQSRFMKR